MRSLISVGDADLTRDGLCTVIVSVDRCRVGHDRSAERIEKDGRAIVDKLFVRPDATHRTEMHAAARQRQDRASTRPLALPARRAPFHAVARTGDLQPASMRAVRRDGDCMAGRLRSKGRWRRGGTRPAPILSCARRSTARKRGLVSIVIERAMRYSMKAFFLGALIFRVVHGRMRRLWEPFYEFVRCRRYRTAHSRGLFNEISCCRAYAHGE